MSNLVKCTICGAIFDADLTVCPVCGQGPAFFVPVDPEPEAELHNTEEAFVILGGGPAGVSAAEAIRQRNKTASITLVTDEEVFPYNRPMLTKAFDPESEDLPVHPETWYAQEHIDVLSGRRVESLNPVTRQITLAGGEILSYDKCVYALGASAFVPGLPGVTLPEVSVIRCVQDVRRINALLAGGCRRAVVIGGGVLGLEAAWTLKGLGCEVVVVEAAPRIMARQLDEEASALLTAIAEQQGITILTGGLTEAIEGEAHVTGVRLAGGTVIGADLVIMSIGVRANTAIAKEAGANVDRGVLVDSHMRTSLQDVYAAGDCAEIEGPNAQLWPVAAEMGHVAGANVAGDYIEYAPASFAVTFHGMGTALYAEGDVGTDPEKAYRVESVLDEAKQTLEKRFFEGDALCGVILLGDIAKAAKYAEALEKAQALR